jgi:hypothetical protein
MVGAAGLAHALYRMACARDDPELLALSDVWISRAISGMGTDSAFYNPEIELTPELLGRNALFHTASGIHVAGTLIALAQHDPVQISAQTQSFARAATVPTDNLDLTMGRAGALFGCAMLQEALGGDGLKGLGNRLAEGLWAVTEELAPVPDANRSLNLGIAHGWAGLLYAVLRWHRAVGSTLPGGFRNRLQQLADCGEPLGRGVRWRWTSAEAVGPGIYMSGWCNGSAGLVFLWSLAHEELGEPVWLELAERAGWDAWEGRSSAASLCCGSAGSAYALLNLYRRTGDPAWRSRAVEAMELSLRSSDALQEHPHSLYKGELGLALLICDLSKPEEARMPFFEDEGWPSAPADGS